MGIRMMTRFAWSPCTWESESGTSMQPMDGFWDVQGARDGLWIDGTSSGE